MGVGIEVEIGVVIEVIIDIVVPSGVMEVRTVGGLRPTVPKSSQQQQFLNGYILITTR